ncbi:Pregnancy-associated plasma protein-A [Zhouia amylolytica]|uniref:Pregnancy-associated plasma protein-A n=1 Tax=Zhouia amylolytica TaxID=376730 RepID=A0A1I6PKB2_9FLAO|nr:zinc metalloprotease [Zhouia amylolytica]SFS40652.1 Pregnancy-associated plasma protein-A [Zhouia amylolytica]
MKKVLFTVAALSLLTLSCENEKVTDTSTEAVVAQEIDMSDFYVYPEEDDLASKSANEGKNCYSMQVLKRQLDQDPNLYNRMYNIEKNLRTFIAAKKPDGVGNGNGNGGNDGGGDPPVDDGLGTINIPVVVHVLYNTDQENISDAQINSQIQILNEDFTASNNDLNQVPGEFEPVVADVNVTFTLDQVIRKFSTKTSWGTRDAMKDASQGGSDAVDPSNYLNIWVCNIGGGILGYAQFPGGNASTDGVVISPQYFGDQGYVSAPFDKGRTATHEVGHWMNLRHIWGDGRCRQDDFVADTPASDGPNYGCPSYPTVNCKSNDMTMNYMDYVDDACMYMFSEGQKARMRAIFAAGGARESFLN